MEIVTVEQHTYNGSGALWYYKNVEGYRDKMIQQAKDNRKKRYEKDPECRKADMDKNNKRMQNKYATDPEYREKVKQRARERYWQKKNSQNFP